jgi:hypothetical protein
VFSCPPDCFGTEAGGKVAWREARKRGSRRTEERRKEKEKRRTE